MTKYNAKRTWSTIWNRMFASKMEAQRAEELFLMQKAGVISDLQFQHKFVLSVRPKVTIAIDFVYMENGAWVYEDSKGVLTRDFRTKLSWLKEKYRIDVILNRGY